MMKKILKAVACIIFCIIFMTGCSSILPFLPNINSGNGGSGDSNTVCEIMTSNSILGASSQDNVTSLSVASYKNAKASTVKIAACYTINKTDVDLEASGFIFDKEYNGENQTYTYYISTSASGTFYRYLSATGEKTVVREGAFEIVMDDDCRYSAVLAGYFDAYDVAVFKFESKNDYDVLEFADSDLMDIGDNVYAIGTPTNGYNLMNTMLGGTISGFNRLSSITSTSINESIATYPTFQMDCPINDGMQGGPVVNANGQVVGAIGLKYGSSYESLGFAIASNDLYPILKSIKNTGTFSKPLLGILVTDIYNAINDTNSSWLSTYNIYKGVYITYDTATSVGVSANGVADKAGMKSNTVITKIINDGKTYELVNMSSLYSALVRIDITKTTQIVAINSYNISHTYTVSWK